MRACVAVYFQRLNQFTFNNLRFSCDFIYFLKCKYIHHPCFYVKVLVDVYTKQNTATEVYFQRQKLQVDVIASALTGIYVSPDFTRYECFGSLEIIIEQSCF